VTLVHAPDLLAHAQRERYRLCTFAVRDLALLQATARGAAESAAPVVVAVTLNEGAEMLLPAVEAWAQRVAVPVVLEGRVASEDDAVAAIRLGCNSLAYPPQASADVFESLAHDCGVHVAPAAETTAPSNAEAAAIALRTSGSAGRAAAATAECRRWRNVEHTIVYNVAADAERTRRMVALGKEVLAAIPGVRRVFAGRAYSGDGKYRYCWIVRFAHAAVIESYRKHPAHLAFADAEFRPVAQDRISIDFEDEG
jgi:fructose-bisphosphate aldolase class II